MKLGAVEYTPRKEIAGKIKTNSSSSHSHSSVNNTKGMSNIKNLFMSRSYFSSSSQSQSQQSNTNTNTCEGDNERERHSKSAADISPQNSQTTTVTVTHTHTAGNNTLLSLSSSAVHDVTNANTMVLDLTCEED